MLTRAFCITHPRFAAVRPLDVFHRQHAPYEDRHDPALCNRHILFRRRFALDAAPRSAVLSVSADDYYKLYVNGVFVTQGPAPGYPFHYYYNDIDLSPYLRRGENVIAVHTFYQGLNNRVWVSGDQRHMFICSLDCDGRTVLISDESWKCTEHTGYSSSHLIGYATQFAEDYDSRAPEVGFEAPDFDDTSWGQAVLRQDPDYTFFAQPTRQLDIYSVKPASVLRMSRAEHEARIAGVTYRVKGFSAGSTEKAPDPLPEDIRTVLFGDVGYEAVGGLCLKARGVPGSRIVIRCGEERLEADGTPVDAVRCDMRCNCLYEETWTLSGGEDILVPYDYKGFRYFEVLLPDGCEIRDIAMQVRHYPFREAIACPSADPDIRRIWQLCSDTLRRGTQEVYMDCPTREKGQYLGDAKVSAAAQMLITGDGAMMKKTLWEFARSAFITPGIMSEAPCSFMQEIADSSLLYPEQLLWYCRHAGDRDTLAALAPYALGVRRWFARFDRGDGLITNVDSWNLVDWPENLRDGYDVPLTQPIGPECHNVINAYWYGCQKRCDAICAELGLPFDPAAAQRTADAYVREFYDPEQKLFTDTAATKHTAIHSNMLPLYFGLDTPEGAREAILALIEEKGLTCMGMLLSYFLLAGLKKAGEDALVKKLLLSEGGWLRMLREGATTTFEAWGKDEKWNTSLFHPWGTAPILILGDPLL